MFFIASAKDDMGDKTPSAHTVGATVSQSDSQSLGPTVNLLPSLFPYDLNDLNWQSPEEAVGVSGAQQHLN